MDPKKHKRLHALYRPVQLIAPHAAGCAMVTAGEPNWHAPEVRYGWKKDRVTRDLTGRCNKRAGHNWLVFQCNSVDCGAELAIYLPHVEAQLDVHNPKYLKESL